MPKILLAALLSLALTPALARKKSCDERAKKIVYRRG